MTDHPSSSHEQSEAEDSIRRAVASDLEVRLEARQLSLPGGAKVEIDGVSDDESVLVEIYAHQGRLKGGQIHKVASDALRLVTLARDRPGTKLIIAFADHQAAMCVTGKSWLADALRAWNIDVRTVELDAATCDGLRAAQVRQVMTNPIGA